MKGLMYNTVHVPLLSSVFSFDRTLGGFEMELRLRNHLAKVFNEQKKTKKDVKENARAMAKLLKEAQRLKTVLSANAEHVAQVRRGYALRDVCVCAHIQPQQTVSVIKITEILLSEVLGLALYCKAFRESNLFHVKKI